MTDTGTFEDLNSRNGVKVNGTRISERRLDPGDILSVAKHDYEVTVFAGRHRARSGPPPADVPELAIFGKALVGAGGAGTAKRHSELRLCRFGRAGNDTKLLGMSRAC